MVCPYCQVARVENEAPCPNCGGPSPLLGRSQANSWQAAGQASWGGPPSVSPQQWSSAAGPQLSFDASPAAWPQNTAQQQNQQQYWSHVSDPLGSSSQKQQDPSQYWSHVSDPPEASVQAQFWSSGVGIREASPAQNPQVQPEYSPDQRQSMLPALYQGGAPQIQQGLSHFTQQMIPVQNIEHLLPALPAEEDAVYVPPMYTKPRPIIPRYRIISGFLSIIIVSLLVCGGAGYYAQASGTVARVQQAIGMSIPPNLKPTLPAQIPDPPDKVDEGPAKDIIRSAAIAARIDPTNKIALQPQQVFAVNQQFFVTYSVAAQQKAGQVTVRWYMNDRVFQSKSISVKANNSINGYVNEAFAVPAPGKVELLWNDQLARTLYFAVK